MHAGAIAANADGEARRRRRRLPGGGPPRSPRLGAEVREADAIMDAADIDAVLITTPTDLHAAMIEQAAWAGKAIFCEKPIDLDVERVRACLAVVESAGVPLMVGFNRRFDPNFVELTPPDRRGRDRQGRDGADRPARSRPAAGRLHQALGRHVPRHDDP